MLFAKLFNFSTSVHINTDLRNQLLAFNESILSDTDTDTDKAFYRFSKVLNNIIANETFLKFDTDLAKLLLSYATLQYNVKHNF